MGIEIEQERVTAADHERFKARLRHALGPLDEVLARPGFGQGERTIGAELELVLIDGRARPFPVNEQVESAAQSPLVTPELGAFSIELNTPPVPLAGPSFSSLASWMRDTTAAIEREASARVARSVPISILPTFRDGDFARGSITDRPRYRALVAGLRRLRQGPFRVRVDGAEPLELVSDEISIERANLAFQLHVRTAPDELAAMFNAAMMSSAPLLAAAGNSPTFLGHRLWQETRVALFQRAGDDRPPSNGSEWEAPGRTGFGTGWVREDDALRQMLEAYVEQVNTGRPVHAFRDPDGLVAEVQRV